MCVCVCSEQYYMASYDIDQYKGIEFILTNAAYFSLKNIH